MRLPSIDLEMIYWRARRRTQRVRAAYRARVSSIRADLNLRYLHLFGYLPERPEPEETFVYRSLWAVAVAGVILAITIEAIGQDEFARRIDALFAAKRTVAEHVPRPAATQDVVAVLKQPNT